MGRVVRCENRVRVDFLMIRNGSKGVNPLPKNTRPTSLRALSLLDQWDEPSLRQHVASTKAVEL